MLNIKSKGILEEWGDYKRLRSVCVMKTERGNYFGKKGTSKRSTEDEEGK